MYAIIETGGKQYRVQKGDVIDVELLDTSAQGIVDFSHVLFVNDGTAIKVGNPYVKAGLVRAEFLQEIKGPKEIAFKYKRRKRIRRKVGHRQRYSRIKITEIVS